MSDAADAAGRQALAALERALAGKPRRDGEAFSEATEHLCRMRDALIDHCRQGAQGRREGLGEVNAIISSALAGHFPLGETPWPEVRGAAEHLRALLAKS